MNDELKSDGFYFIVMHFIAKSEEFLAKYLGGRLEPISEIKGHAGVIK